MLRIKRKKKTKSICKNCIWWKSEELNGLIVKNGKKRYCDKNKKYTKSNSSCNSFSKELFKPTKNSIQSKEYNLDLDLDLKLKNKK